MAKRITKNAALSKLKEWARGQIVANGGKMPDAWVANYLTRFEYRKGVAFLYFKLPWERQEFEFQVTKKGVTPPADFIKKWNKAWTMVTEDPRITFKQVDSIH